MKTPTQKIRAALTDAKEEFWDSWHSHMSEGDFENHSMIMEIDAALKALEQIKNPWRPIESAPRDGTRILINKSNTMFHDFAEVRWMQDRNYKMGWVGYDCEGQFTAINPTLWQPITPPQKGE